MYRTRTRVPYSNRWLYGTRTRTVTCLHSCLPRHFDPESKAVYGRTELFYYILIRVFVYLNCADVSCFARAFPPLPRNPAGNVRGQTVLYAYSTIIRRINREQANTKVQYGMPPHKMKTVILLEYSYIRYQQAIERIVSYHSARSEPGASIIRQMTLQARSQRLMLTDRAGT